MEQILRTDNAYQAIDKINANFASSTGDLIMEGSFEGQDNLFLFAILEDVKPGDILHVQFSSDWVAPSALNADQAKLAFGYHLLDNSLQPSAFIFKNYAVSSAGYDVLISTIENFKDFYVAVKVRSGVTIDYTITRYKGMRKYYAAELFDTHSKIRKALTGGETFCFPLLTDIHYISHGASTDRSVKSPYLLVNTCENISQLSKYVRMENLICMGDIIDGRDERPVSIRDAKDTIRLLNSPGIPRLTVVGNHDDNRLATSSNYFTPAEIYNDIVQSDDERASVDGAMNGLNWYRDDPRHKIRYIGLCAITFSQTYQYTTDTRNWLTATFASMPEGYQALIFTHTPPLGKWAWSGTQYSGGIELSNIIKTNLDKVIAVFFGHTHLDNSDVSPYVALNFSSNKCYDLVTGMADSPAGSVFPSRTTGTYTEDLWDVVIVDQADSLITCIRFGGGCDRYVHFSPVSVPIGGSAILTASCITPATWGIKSADSAKVSVTSGGVVSVTSAATAGDRLYVEAKDSQGNTEIWVILAE